MTAWTKGSIDAQTILVGFCVVAQILRLFAAAPLSQDAKPCRSLKV